jgi:hypothetical protein
MSSGYPGVIPLPRGVIDSAAEVFQMAVIYQDSDADLSGLAGASIAVVGYGNQGRSQALNLRDSGFPVAVGNRRDRPSRRPSATASRCARSPRR